MMVDRDNIDWFILGKYWCSSNVHLHIRIKKHFFVKKYRSNVYITVTELSSTLATAIELRLFDVK